MQMTSVCNLSLSDALIHNAQLLCTIVAWVIEASNNVARDYISSEILTCRFYINHWPRGSTVAVSSNSWTFVCSDSDLCSLLQNAEYGTNGVCAHMRASSQSPLSSCYHQFHGDDDQT
jgi:hypothetical protein